MNNPMVFGALPCNEVLGFARAPQLDYGAPQTTPGVLGTILVESGATAAIWAPHCFHPADFLTATQGSYALACAAADVGLKRLVVISTMQLFSRIPQSWHLGTNWRPRPGRGAPTLFPFLAELSVQEVARATGLKVTVLRLGRDVSQEAASEAVRQSLNDSKPWVVRHVGDAPGRPETDGGKSWREILGPVEPIISRPIRKVVILGAGGPIGRTVADAQFLQNLADDHFLSPLNQYSPILIL